MIPCLYRILNANTSHLPFLLIYLFGGIISFTIVGVHDYHPILIVFPKVYFSYFKILTPTNVNFISRYYYDLGVYCLY